MAYLDMLPDNGPPLDGNKNRLEEISEINQWIVEFNKGYGNRNLTFHRLGVRSDLKES